MALKRLIVLVITGVSAFQAWAQDPHFSQFYANPIYLNPAFAGVAQCPTVHANYRNQYPGMGVYQTYSTSIDQYVDELNGGLGLIILQDESANRTLRLTEASLVYSYHLKVNRKFSVLTGFQGTFRQRALDWGNLTFPDQIDPFYGFVKPTNEIAPNQTNTSNVDLSIGMVGFTENFYFGASAHHLTQPDEGFFRNGNLPVKVGAQAGATLRMGRKRLYNSLDNLLIPNVVYQRTRRRTSNYSRGFVQPGSGERRFGLPPSFGSCELQPRCIGCFSGFSAQRRSLAFWLLLRLHHFTFEKYLGRSTRSNPFVPIGLPYP